MCPESSAAKGLYALFCPCSDWHRTLTVYNIQRSLAGDREPQQLFCYMLKSKLKNRSKAWKFLLACRMSVAEGKLGEAPQHRMGRTVS